MHETAYHNRAWKQGFEFQKDYRSSDLKLISKLELYATVFRGKTSERILKMWKLSVLMQIKNMKSTLNQRMNLLQSWNGFAGTTTTMSPIRLIYPRCICLGLSCNTPTAAFFLQDTLCLAASFFVVAGPLLAGAVVNLGTWACLVHYSKCWFFLKETLLLKPEHWSLQSWG
jgi:hypothetical protein